MFQTRRMWFLVLATFMSFMTFTACSTTTVTAVVTGVTVAAEAALSVLGNSGQLPPALAAQISTYLQVVGTSVTQTTTELASKDTSAMKAAKIASIWANAVAPNLPVCGQVTNVPCVSPNVAAIVQSVQAAVKALLAQLAPGTVSAQQLAAADKYKLTMGDKHTLGNLFKRGRAITEKAALLH